MKNESNVYEQSRHNIELESVLERENLEEEQFSNNNFLCELSTVGFQDSILSIVS